MVMSKGMMAIDQGMSVHRHRGFVIGRIGSGRVETSTGRPMSAVRRGSGYSRLVTEVVRPMQESITRPSDPIASGSDG
jgi:hypothetical protein